MEQNWAGPKGGPHDQGLPTRKSLPWSDSLSYKHYKHYNKLSLAEFEFFCLKTVLRDFDRISLANSSTQAQPQVPPARESNTNLRKSKAIANKIM